LKSRREANDQVMKYFEREWRIMAECRHPNIVLFLGLCMAPKDDGRCLWVLSLRTSFHLHFSRTIDWLSFASSSTWTFTLLISLTKFSPESHLAIPRADDSIVSEYVPKGNLRSFMLGRRPFPWRLRLSFATDIARAIAYLHARDVRSFLSPFSTLVSPNPLLTLWWLARVWLMSVRSSRYQRRKPLDYR